MGDKKKDQAEPAKPKRQVKPRLKSTVSFIHEATEIEHALRAIAERRARAKLTYQKRLRGFELEESELLHKASNEALKVLQQARIVNEENEVSIEVEVEDDDENSPAAS